MSSVLKSRTAAASGCTVFTEIFSPTIRNVRKRATKSTENSANLKVSSDDPSGPENCVRYFSFQPEFAMNRIRAAIAIDRGTDRS